GEVAGRNIRHQPGLNQRKIVDVSAVGPMALVSDRDIVVPKPTLKHAGGIVEHVLEIEIARVEIAGSHSSLLSRITGCLSIAARACRAPAWPLSMANRCGSPVLPPAPSTRRAIALPCLAVVGVVQPQCGTLGEPNGRERGSSRARLR